MSKTMTRFWAMLLSAVLAIALIPSAALADGTDASTTSAENSAADSTAGNSSSTANGTNAASGGSTASASTVQNDSASLQDSGSASTSSSSAEDSSSSSSSSSSSASSSGSSDTSESTKAPNAYAKTPKLVYNVKSRSNKKHTYRDAKAHAIAGGLASIRLKKPVSSVKGAAVSGNLSYRVKYANGRLGKTMSAGKWAGSPSSKAIVQAFQLKTTGKLSKHYVAYYRVKLSKLGWTGWARNGQWAGTAYNQRIVGIQIKLVRTSGSAPGATRAHYVKKSSLRYQANILGKGWKHWVKSGSVTGNTSYQTAIKQIRMKARTSYSGGISYRVLTRTGTWSAWKSRGKAAGSVKPSKRARAVQIKLTSTLAKKYDVYYRVYAGDYGWTGWAKNGASAGTKFANTPVGALQVKLVFKGAKAPGKTKNSYITKKFALSGLALKTYHKAQKFSSRTHWLVLINLERTRVAVFHGSKGNWKLKRFVMCSPGAPGTPTVRGTYTAGIKMYSFGEDRGFSCYYATQITGDYLMHSVTYYANTRTVMEGKMGVYISHGCVRMLIADAKYIYDHVPSGSKIYIY
ncbi:MAG: L,D-transpeptidase family protein [Eggerthellaceae bacterium]|jgi:lipoprotein-anchoring transpeptidase ErfK/SrfK